MTYPHWTNLGYFSTNHLDFLLNRTSMVKEDDTLKGEIPITVIAHPALCISIVDTRLPLSAPQKSPQVFDNELK